MPLPELLLLLLPLPLLLLLVLMYGALSSLLFLPLLPRADQAAG